MADDPDPPREKSRGEILAEQDGMTEERILDEFNPFYTMKIWKLAADSLEQYRGLSSKTYHLIWNARSKEIGSQYTPFDYYATLREGFVPQWTVTDPLKLLEAELHHMQEANRKRMVKGKKLKYSVNTLDVYEEAVDELRKVVKHGEQRIRSEEDREKRRGTLDYYGKELHHQQGGENSPPGGG